MISRSKATQRRRCLGPQFRRLKFEFKDPLMRLETHMPNFAYTSERRSGLGLRLRPGSHGYVPRDTVRSVRNWRHVLSKDIKN